MVRRDTHARVGGAAEVERRIGLLHGREEDLAALDLQVLAVEVDGLAGHQPAPDLQELVGELVARGMVQEEAVALQLDGIAARHDVDEEPTVRQPVERGRHPCGNGRRLQTRTDGHEVAEAARLGRQCRGDHPAVLARPSGRDEDAEVTLFVGCLGDLAQIVDRDLAGALGGAEIAPVAVRRQEPENVGGALGAHAAAFQTTSRTLIGFGRSPMRWKVSAMLCCSFTTSSVSGFTP